MAETIVWSIVAPGVGVGYSDIFIHIYVGSCHFWGSFFLFFLSLLVRSYMSITPGSANLEILIK